MEEKKDVRDHRGRTNNIIYNNWNQVEIDTRDIKFNLSALLEQYNVEDDLEEKERRDIIHNLIISNYKEYNDVIKSVKKTGEDSFRVKLLNKKEMNIVFDLLVKETNYKHLAILQYLTDYFTINTFKFFNGLSNIYKQEILTELYDTKPNGIINNNSQLY